MPPKLPPWQRAGGRIGINLCREVEDPLRKILGLWICFVVLLALMPNVALAQQAFEGQLDVVHYEAPEFPPPANMSTSGPPNSAPTNPIQESAPRGPGGGMPAGVPSPQQSQAPSFTSNGITWINSRPLTMRELRGQVVLIDFWEYTCINCIRTFDTNKKWYERYHGYGFQIVGVHDPEFSIAFSVKNARAAVKRFELPYPIVVDDDRLIWNAYRSDSWPNRFLIDANGYVRYHRAGEGGDGAFEQAIQQLLVEAHPGLKFPASDVVPPPENAFATGCGITTPEMYVGDWYGRGILANPEGYHLGKSVKYQLPAAVDDGRVVLSGRWETYHDGMTYRGKKGKSAGELEMRYHARQIYSVINVSRGHPERLYITQDGKNLTNANKGIDVQLDAQGRSYIQVREPRMYYLVANPSFGSHTVVLTPTAPGITINSFTFGNNCQTDFSHL
jgi:thiol-disulfide isomerase/thioredoxin